MKLDELKTLIRETVQDVLAGQEGGQVQIGKAYRFKEELMKVVQEGLRADADMIESQDEYEGYVDQEIEKVREDIDLTLSMIGRALYQVPFQAFKGPESK